MTPKTAYMLGVAFGLPLGAVVAVGGFLIGLFGHAWTVLWIGVSIMGLSILLAMYSMLVPVFRLSTGMKLMTQQMAQNVVGQGIRWQEIQGAIFRVLSFTPNASVDGDKVTATSRFEPYGMLKVESPGYEDALVMPILHRLDFFHVWRCFNDCEVGTDEELMVAYDPHKRWGKKMPHLALMIGPKGATEVFSRSSSAPQAATDAFKSTRFYWKPERAWER